MLTRNLISSQSSGEETTAVDDVFSTYVYQGTNASNNSIVNGINLSEEGGLVWFKSRENSRSHALFDTERGVEKILVTNITNGETTNSTGLTAFNSDGFTMGDLAEINGNEKLVSWTFRKDPRFFNVITYTGNSVSEQAIAHGMASADTVGMVVVKSLSSGDWFVWHRSFARGSVNDYMERNAGGKIKTSTGIWGSGLVDVNNFRVGGSNLNASGQDYVMYIFAHDPDGEDDDGMIACGEYTAVTGSPAVVDLGWEPQYVMIKQSTGPTNRDWIVQDNVRGLTHSAEGVWLRPNTSDPEGNSDAYQIIPSPTGFSTSASEHDSLFEAGQSYIYMAIRKSNRIPTSSTEVFDLGLRAGTSADVTVPINITPDVALITPTTAWYKGITVRGYATNPVFIGLNQNSISFYDTNRMDVSDGIFFGPDPTLRIINGSADTYMDYFFKQGRGFMDKLDYTGTGSTFTSAHNLGVAPEMVIVLRHNSNRQPTLWHSDLGAQDEMVLGSVNTPGNNGSFSSTIPTATQIVIFGANFTVNDSASEYTALMFATRAGVSKVGSYTGNGSSQNIACGFSAGARFILIKRTDSSGQWYIWDSVRGIVDGNDPHLSLSNTLAQVTTDDSIDPLSSGFIVNQVAATDINVTSGEYIFYAIA